MKYRAMVKHQAFKMDVKINYSNKRSRTVSAQLINGNLIVNGKLKINSIEYATDQNSRFGCCNRRDASIRISHRLSRMPEWVRDCVIVHEMAHLVEPNHSAAFWSIVSRYELAERAKGYLMAVGFDSENEQDLVNS